MSPAARAALARIARPSTPPALTGPASARARTAADASGERLQRVGVAPLLCEIRVQLAKSHERPLLVAILREHPRRNRPRVDVGRIDRTHASGDVGRDTPR